MHALRCGVQGYAWGSRTLIPEFLGREPDGQPQAELWIGAHPALPSQVMIDGDWVGLDAFVASDPERHLGSTTLARFGPRLPMLMKVLAVEAPLSLQAHPSPAQAKAGFARENEAGIALASPLRSYRDDGAKPELLWALTPFRALGGFLDPEAAATALDAVGGPMLRAWSATIRLRGVDGLRQG